MDKIKKQLPEKHIWIVQRRCQADKATQKNSVNTNNNQNLDSAIHTIWQDKKTTQNKTEENKKERAGRSVEGMKGATLDQWSISLKLTEKYETAKRLKGNFGEAIRHRIMLLINMWKG